MAITVVTKLTQKMNLATPREVLSACMAGEHGCSLNPF